jgi:hypothetical protein
MTLSSEWKQRIEHLLRIPYHSWMKDTCTKEYLEHFHKNYSSGNKSLMRKLWSQKVLDPIDIPRELTGLTYVSENYVKYSKDHQEYYANTLPGLLTKSIPNLAQDLYHHIMELDVYFDWEVRGPRLFETILKANPDLISLCEYDIHDAVAAYRDLSTRETFADAMSASGYSGFLLKSPDPRSESGLGIFWKSEEYELIYESSFDIPTFPTITTINIDTDLNGIVSNFDLHEHWHKLSFSTNPEAEAGKEAGTLSSTYQEMSQKDRRHVGFLRLRNKLSQKVILVVFTHLMTTSRDCQETNEYPGEVRFGEMDTIGSIIYSYLNNSTSAPIDGIIYSGDFNIDLREFRKLYHGVQSTLDPTRTRSFQTGFLPNDNQESVGFHPCLQYHPDPRWILHEAFEGTHLWGDEDRIGSAKESQVCTRFNHERCEWIDMVWYSSQSLRVRSLSSMNTPLTPIPNELHGSDHLPLCVEFEWK